MNLLNDFCSQISKFENSKRLGEDRIMDSLKRFFSNKKIWKFKKCWGKVGLWIPLNDFFYLRKF